MSLSATTLPHQFMAAYSAVPLRLYDPSYFESNNYKYLTSIIWDSVIATGNTASTYLNTVYTRLNFSTPHNFKRGDLVLLNNNTNDITESGFYTILVINDTTSITINRIFEIQLGSNNIKVSKVLPYKMPPDPDGEAKLDLSNTLKDFVTEDLYDINIPYEAPNTKFGYDIVIGNESVYTFTFESNVNSGGTLGFYDSLITSTSGIPFQVGDLINVEQDLYGWPYIDNVFLTGNVGYTGTTYQPFLTGQQILVTGQITNPQYNGFQVVETGLSGIFGNAIRTLQPFGDSSPVEPGIIWGTPRPSYNGVATIIDIFIDPIYGYTIITDKTALPFTPIIGGTITYADGRVSSQPILQTYTGYSVYNSFIKRPNWSRIAFDRFIIRNRANNLNFISTILLQSTTTPLQTYRIERSAKSWLLAHATRTDITGARYNWFDSGGNSLGYSIITGATNMEDFYVPVGFDQIANSSNRVDFCTFNDVDTFLATYTVGISSNSTIRTNVVKFFINNDCSRYELYHLVWKDSNGSWLAFPFQYLSQDTTEIERKNFYKKEGSWSNSGFGYNSYDRGEKTFFLRSRDKILLNSGWLDESENELIKDLMTSPYVMLQTPDNKLISCIVEEDEITFKENMNDQLINYTLNVRISYNNNRF